MKTIIQSVVLSVVLLCSGAIQAEPTVKEIYQTAQTDRAKALTMVDEVIAAHPKSSKAYFVRAEILLSLGKNSQAKDAFVRAEQLDPTFNYAKAEAVARVRNKLGIKPESSFSRDSLVIFGLIVLLGILVIWLIIRRKPVNEQSYVPTNYTNRPITPFSPAPTSGVNTAQPTATPGGGIMSSLATGAAVGAGAVAGAALANHLINGSKGNSSTADEPTRQSDYTPSTDFGVDSGSWDSGSSDSSSDSGSSDW